MNDRQHARAIQAEQERDVCKKANASLLEGLRIMAESDDDWYIGTTPMKEYASILLAQNRGET